MTSSAAHRLHGTLRGRRSRAPADPPTTPQIPSEEPSTGTACSLATIPREQSCMEDQDSHVGVARVCWREEGVALACAFSSPPALHTPQPELSDTVFLCEDTKGEDRRGGNLPVSNCCAAETRKLLQDSRVPFVRLERLRTPPAFSQAPGAHTAVERSRPSGPHPDPELPPEGTVSPKPARSCTDQTRQRKTMIISAIPISLPFVSLRRVLQGGPSQDQTASFGQLPPRAKSPLSPSHNPSGVTQNHSQDPSTEPEPHSDLTPQSASKPGLESKPDLESEPNLESESNLESEPDLHLESQPEKDSQLDSGLQPESRLLESEPESYPEAGGQGNKQQPESRPDLGLESEQDLSRESESDLGRESELNQGPLLACMEITRSGSEPDWLQGEGASDGAVQMENEDFCAVCLNGGDLLCCDRCPRVFHLACHIPGLLSFPAGDWLCSLCRDVLQPELEYDCENTRICGEHAPKGLSYGLSPSDQRRCEKLTLLVSCNILSAPFHEPVSLQARHYYQIIKRPMDLSVIRSKLNKRNPLHYYTPDDYVSDICLMFRNCATFNYPDSEVAQAGRSLEAFFQSKLREVFPSQAWPPANDSNSNVRDYRTLRRAGADSFRWPTRKEHCYRKRKRRRPLNWKQLHF